MTKQELSRAVAMVQAGSVGLLKTDKFDGFGYHDFEPVTCTLLELAQLVAWQCKQMNGELDGDALDEIAKAGKTKFMIVGEGSDTP